MRSGAPLHPLERRTLVDEQAKVPCREFERGAVEMLGGTARTGVWIIGSRGSVATTAITGAAAVTAGLATATGLVTMRPPFTEAGLPDLGDLVFGGHDLVETPLAVRAARLVDGGGPPDRPPAAVATPLAAAESEM